MTIALYIYIYISITLGIVIFITWNRRHCNGITITIHKFGYYVWKASKRWCVTKIYIYGNI